MSKLKEFRRKIYGILSPSYREIQYVKNNLNQLEQEVINIKNLNKDCLLQSKVSNNHILFNLYKKFENRILNDFKKVDFPDPNNCFDFSLKQLDVEYPYSCTMEEGLFLADLIVKNNLRQGYEIATAFGISSLFIGMGFQVTNGLLKTMDCYIEESKNDFLYSDDEILKYSKDIKEKLKNGQMPNGLIVAKNSAKKMNIENHIEYIVGVSPNDVEENIQDTLDFVFIDGCHFGNMPTIDFNSVKSHINKEKALLFFHDNNDNKSVKAAIKVAEEYFNTKAIDLNTHWHLTVIRIGDAVL